MSKRASGWSTVHDGWAIDLGSSTPGPDPAGPDTAGHRMTRDEAATQAAERLVEKPWGSERIWAETDRYVGKLLLIRAGKRLSLQYHEVKDEAILVLRGRLRLYLAGADGAIQVTELGPGEHHRVVAGAVHRYEATIEDVELIEISTPELEDVVRIEDDFGRAGTNAP